MANDSDILADVQARLQGLGVFGEVVRGAGPGEEEIPPDRGAVCWVQRAGWREGDRTEDEHHRDLVVRVWIDCWGDGPEDRSERLVALETAVLGALDGQRLADVTFPAFTKVVSGAEDNRPAVKAGRVLLTLQTRYRRL